MSEILKRYIGDSVYAAFDGYGITLTTENGFPDDPSNRIYLGPDEIDALDQFAKVAYAKPTPRSEREA